MFVCKLRTPSCVNYEHFHVYLAYRRQTGTVVTRQAYERASRLTRSPTAHISRGAKSLQLDMATIFFTNKEVIPSGNVIGHYLREPYIYALNRIQYVFIISWLYDITFVIIERKLHIPYIRTRIRPRN